MQKLNKWLLAALFIGQLSACTKIIDVAPISNIGAENYYKNYQDVQTALTGAYNGLQPPLQYEWMLTELRSDNAMQGVTGSSSTQNIDFNDLDMYQPATTLPEIYNYWLAVYRNIRSINYVLRSLGVQYSNGNITEGTPTASVTSQEKKELAGEALFLRAYHYFNLVRLFGGVFIVTDPTDPQEAQQTNRATVNETYQLIEADLRAAASWLPRRTFGHVPNGDVGRANTWAAEALLAKVLLTQHKNAEALPLLDDVINNSGYGLEPNFADIFSTDNEMNQEILFAVRYKAGGLGLGNYMPNAFAPQGSGGAVVNGDGSGWNYPTDDLDSAYRSADQRYPVSIGTYQVKRYAKKFVTQVAVKNDAENDFPVLRYADVLLMKAEAIGFDGPGGQSVQLINQVRQRAGATTYLAGDFNAGFYTYPTDPGDPNAITTETEFWQALFQERRFEFAFENQRLFDLIRAGEAVSTLKNYFANEYPVHYSLYRPQPDLAQLQSNVTTDHLLLPIPQREIDANVTLTIPQNPGY